MTCYAPSFWLSEPNEEARALDAELDCDVVVIGAGYTGLSAAIALSKGGINTVIVEGDRVGFGASGRNAGHLTPTIGKDLPSVLRIYGREIGSALARFADAAVEHTEAVIAELGIDCDYIPHGNVIAGLHPGQETKLRQAADAAREMGAGVRMLTNKELNDRQLPGFVNCAAIESRGGVLDPGKYVRGLYAMAEASGARVFEATPAVRIVERPRQVCVHTPNGMVTARTAVLATNAYTPQLGLRYGSVLPANACQFVTARLTVEQRMRIGWPEAEGVYTAHQSLENYRLTADGRVIGGSRYIGYRWGSRLFDDQRPRTFAKIERRFRDRFPELGDVAVEGFWSGHVAMNLNFLPFIARVGEHSNIVAALGYCGHGVAQASLLGTIAGEMAMRSAQPPAVLTDRTRIPMPPEPLRWLGVHASTAALSVADYLTDRRACPRKREDVS
ncbi:FAD-dependent oxidoreductase [Mycolicibacterium sp. 624]|uniref:NAD(P)/FAD-dependent oxidoreductase n=1 Tax=Mycolicibacterium sp. 624 TaxID=3156314 RepID=UPI003392A6AB